MYDHGYNTGMASVYRFFPFQENLDVSTRDFKYYIMVMTRVMCYLTVNGTPPFLP